MPSVTVISWKPTAISASGYGLWTPATQSAIVPTIWSSQIIDLARNETVVMQAGAPDYSHGR